jgi:hypothetical protein
MARSPSSSNTPPTRQRSSFDIDRTVVPGRPSAIPRMRVALVQRGRDFHGLMTAMRGARHQSAEAMGARWPTRGIYSLRRIELLFRAARLLEKTIGGHVPWGVTAHGSPSGPLQFDHLEAILGRHFHSSRVSVGIQRCAAYLGSSESAATPSFCEASGDASRRPSSRVRELRRCERAIC